MKLIHKTLALTLATFALGSAFAQSTLSSPLPTQGAQQDHGNPSAAADRVLEMIAKNMKPQADLIDATAESNINRDVNISRSTGQLLRPVGYMQIGDERAIFASEDGVRVARLKEQSRFGVMKINKISEDGVDYTVSGKALYAPLTYLASDPPKAVPISTANNLNNNQAANNNSQVNTAATQAMPANALAGR